MITELTPEQEALIDVYREEFRAIGLQTGRCDRPRAEAAIAKYRAALGDTTPYKIYWANSPAESLDICRKLLTEVDKLSEPEIKEYLGKVAESVNYAQPGAYWASMYCYINEVLPVQKTELADLVREIVTTCGMFIESEKAIIIIDRPCKLSYNNNRQLHNPDGPSIAYTDGRSSTYALNGVVMPAFLWEVPKSELDPKKILEIQNTDQRDEAMKWYGLEAFFDVLGARLLDSSGIVQGVEDMYKLFELNLGDATGKYLRIVNPSTGEIHVEGVDNDCKTTEDALKSRMPDYVIKNFGFKKPAYAV